MRFPRGPLLSGLIAAAVATVFGARISPDSPTLAIVVFTRAFVYGGVVFGVTLLATYAAARANRISRAGEIALRTATAALWLAPLWMFSRQSSAFFLVIWMVFVIEVARLVACVGENRAVTQESERGIPEAQTFSVLKQDLPYGTSVLGAFTIEGAFVASMGGHVVTAGLLYLAGTAIIAQRSFIMFRDVAAIGDSDATDRVSAILLATTFLIAFSWLPYLVLHGTGSGRNSVGGNGGLPFGTAGGGGNVRQVHRGAQKSESALAWLRSLFLSDVSESHSNSFTVAKHIFDSSFPQDSTGTTTRLRNTRNTTIPITELVTGPVFPGVELYPEAQPQAKLVAPQQSGKTAAGLGRSDPLSIPFDGVYWFWRGPSDGPPLNSIVMHGSPSAQFFRSTDGDGMSMEAKQNLGFIVDPRQYGAIEIDIQNADPFPHSVSILLKIRNTTLPGKPVQSLGMEDISSPAISPRGGQQTLRFRIPSILAMGRFDELTVSYYLRGARSNRSARIAIERFRLVPRGG